MLEPWPQAAAPKTENAKIFARQNARPADVLAIVPAGRILASRRAYTDGTIRPTFPVSRNAVEKRQAEHAARKTIAARGFANARARVPDAIATAVPVSHAA